MSSWPLQSLPSSILTSSCFPRHCSALPPRQPPPPGLAPPTGAIQRNTITDHQWDARQKATAMNQAKKLLCSWKYGLEVLTSQNSSLNISLHIWREIQKWEHWTSRHLRFLVLCFQVGGASINSLVDTSSKMTSWGGREGSHTSKQPQIGG